MGTVALRLDSETIPDGLPALVEAANPPRIVRSRGQLWLLSMDYNLSRRRLYLLDEPTQRRDWRHADCSSLRVVYVGLQRYWMHPVTRQVVGTKGDGWGVFIASTSVLSQSQGHLKMLQVFSGIGLVPRGAESELPPASFEDWNIYYRELWLYSFRSEQVQ